MERRRRLGLQEWPLFLLFLLQISFYVRFLATAQTDGESFLQVKERQVQAIAAQAVVNANDTACDLISSCTASNCSRATCHYVLSDLNSYDCVNAVESNTTCSCNGFQANFERSYVRVPFLSDPNSINTERVFAICSQRVLDPLFRSFPKNETFYSYYLGTVDGTFRLYPGIVDNRCDTYDPRSRPWYVGAISVIKELVVLVDVSVSMGADFGFFENVTPISSALNMTRVLLGTLTEGDRVTVISYSNASSSIVGATYSVPGPTVNMEDSTFKALLDSVGSITLSQVKGSNITAGIAEARSVLDSGLPGTSALKVIVVFTDGAPSVPPEDLDSLVAPLNEAGVTLFMYQINGMNEALRNFACNVTWGYNEQLSINPVLNPSYALRSYFSFLARERRSADPQQLSFWQPPYPDFGFLGEVITVAYPSISPSGDLVGVAGIDVQVRGLSQPLREEINKALATRTTKPPPPLPSSSRAGFTICDAGVSMSTPCNINSAAQNAVCPKTDTHTLEQLLCCRGCGGFEPEGSKTNLTPLWICLGIVGAVAIFGLAFVLKRRYSGGVLPPPPPPGSKQPRIVPAPNTPARDTFL